MNFKKEMAIVRLREGDWSQFWQGSTITTFQGVYGENYTGEIRQFWQRHLSSEYSSIVDVACGNGALCWIVNELVDSGRSEMRVTGVDFADIKPFKRLGRSKSDYPRVSFIANTAVEELPFESASIDLVVSQYGLEYSDLSASIPELGRVVSDKGTICLVAHRSDSVLVQTEMRMLEACEAVLEEDRLHDLYLALDTLMRKTKDDDLAEISKLKRDIAHVTYRVRNRLQSFRKKVDIDNYLYRMEKVFAENTPRRSKKRQKEVELARDTLQAFVNRLQDLRAAALTPERLSLLKTLLGQEGFSVVEECPLHIEEGVLWGLGLVAQR